LVTECNSAAIFDSAVVLFGAFQHGEYAAHDFAVIPGDVCHEQVAAFYHREVESFISG
jgi:hypothetical protein